MKICTVALCLLALPGIAQIEENSDDVQVEYQSSDDVVIERQPVPPLANNKLRVKDQKDTKHHYTERDYAVVQNSVPFKHPGRNHEKNQRQSQDPH